MLTNPFAPLLKHLIAKEPSSPTDPNIYSTIKKSQQNGKIPRFRRVKGDGELYTSDTVMQSEYRSMGPVALPQQAASSGSVPHGVAGRDPAALCSSLAASWGEFHLLASAPRQLA